MRSFFSALLVSAFLLSAGAAHAQDAVGAVNTNINTGNVAQSNSGTNNKNDVAIGTVKTSSSKKVGVINSNINTGNVSQSNSGTNNANRIKIGTVE